MRTAGLEPALSCKKQIFVPLRLSPPPCQAFVVWTVPSPWPSQALGATRPVSTPSPNRGLGSGLAWGLSPLAFPDFERFYSEDFPTGTPIKVCCVYRFRHVRASGFVPHRAHARNCGVQSGLAVLTPVWPPAYMRLWRSGRNLLNNILFYNNIFFDIKLPHSPERAFLSPQCLPFHHAGSAGGAWPTPGGNKAFGTAIDIRRWLGDRLSSIQRKR